ncbi:hypothetical protein ACFPM3_20090 [Streptomyces coeruleoprunus]|uniref:Uncharacterized protein n=1 Tax=Streptomyces coeruleoprunus TaxID=285563 RepID=A0ABV9XHH5_9ACTN
MQEKAPITAEEASRQLKEHSAGERAPEINISWRDEVPDPAASRRVLEILFRPRVDSDA